MVTDSIDHIIDRFVKDENARQYLKDLWIVIQAWDDAFDGDENPDLADAYRRAVVDMPRNPYFLMPGVHTAARLMYLNWHAANQLEKEKIDLEKAYMLRAMYYQCILLAMDICHGQKYAEENAALLWRHYGEKFEDYLQEMNDA